MKAVRVVSLGLALMAAGCAHPPAPAIVAAAPPPVPAVTAPPTQLAVPAAEPAIDPAIVALVQRDLKALGYNAGKAGDLADPLFQRAIATFAKDQGLTEDGTLSAAFVDRLKLATAAALKPQDAGRSALYVYSDGAVRSQALGLVMPAPAGLTSNAPANFMHPLRPGSQASFQFGTRAKDGSFKAATTVTCQAGRAAQSAVPLGPLAIIAVECRGDGTNPPQWRALYSTALGVVVRLESPAGNRDLVAIRPVTNDWPSAARTGLDWAMTHALEANAAGAALPWSSTAVTAHFEIRAAAKISGQEAGLAGKYAAEACRRFELVQAGTPPQHYPGIACQGAPGSWSLPGSAPFAAPANGIAARTLPAASQNARN